MTESHMKKTKAKKIPETIKVTIPVTLPVTMHLRTKGMTVRDLARAAFMLGLELEPIAKPLKGRT